MLSTFPLDSDEYELTPSSTVDYDDHAQLLAREYNPSFAAESRARSRYWFRSSVLRPLKKISRIRWSQWSRSKQRNSSSSSSSRSGSCVPRSYFRKFVLVSYSFLGLIIFTTIIGAIFFPSYTYPPAHYTSLRHQATSSEEPGRGNRNNQKIFIAASIYDRGGRLTGGDWAKNVLALIDLLGPQNTFLSVYENDSGVEGKASLDDFEKLLDCDYRLLYEEHLDIDKLPHVKLADGTERVKRIAYLAEVRNRALEPIFETNARFDRLLYLNDVMFDPVDVLQLLFSTNADRHGRAHYRAACAVDFVNPFKFYDTYATRDTAGYSMGVPFFPWFSAFGDGISHQDVIYGEDAVRVKSCWGGMVAFDASFFQRPEVSGVLVPTAANTSPSNLSAPYRFRAESDLYWESSECCLIQADIQNPEPGHSGIYMNPFVRVAYDSRTLSWLAFTRRFEQLYSPIHFLVDILVSMPGYNPRREERAWQEVEEKVWVPDSNSTAGGSFQILPRIATHTGFCGRRKLAVMKENITSGERNWENSPVPS